MTRVNVYITQIWGLKYPSYPCRQKIQILLFNLKWDISSALNIESEKYFVSKNRGAGSLKGVYHLAQILQRCKNLSTLILK